MSKLLLSFILFFLAQTLIWIQTNGQFLWVWFKKNPLILSMTLGTAISYLLIYATKYVVEYYDGLLWPGRFIGFGSGIIVFAFLTWYLLGEAITIKTLVSLGLATTLIAIQLFWK